MISTGPCEATILDILAGLPSESADFNQYLLTACKRYVGHPCYFRIAGEISRVLLSLSTPDEFVYFCTKSGDPEPFLVPLLADLSSNITARSYEQASAILPFLLPFGERLWPESDSEEYRSFRDLIEYTWYLTECEPKHDVIVLPFLATDILYLYGKYLKGIKEDEKALSVLEKARYQSPVHAGILGEIISLMLSNGHTTQAVPLLVLSFKTAWMKEDLAAAFRNQGFLFSLQEDEEAAITCYLMAETWEESPGGREELKFITGQTGDIDYGYFNRNGKKILSDRKIPCGPNPVIISLLTGIAENYLDENNLMKAREYLIRAGQLLMSEEIEDQIQMIERRLEEGGIF
jgi:tetratricopeptide (TPR) repeat protein